MKKSVLFSLLIVLLVLAAVPALNAQAKKTFIIVANGQGPGSTAFSTLFSSEVVSNLEAMGVVIASSSDPNFAARVAAISDVQWVSEDRVVQWLDPREKNIAANDSLAPVPAYSTANVDKYYPIQWNIRQIHADQTAAMNVLGNSKVRARVAVLDSGIITTHPDIAPNLNLALSRSYVPGEGLNPPYNTFNHGTHVAGIIAAAINNVGTQGVAPEAEIVAVKVLSAAGSGSFAWMIEGLDYASGPDVHADIINMSLGALFNIKPSAPGANKGGWGTFFSALNRAVNLATQRGTLVISAAGNDGTNLNSSWGQVPAQSGNGMAVSAVGPIGWGINGDPSGWDTPVYYSNYGQSVVNIAGPGGNDVLYGTPEGMANCTESINPPGSTITRPCYAFDMVISPAIWNEPSPGTFTYSYTWADGTSMAAPHVAGVAALIVGEKGHMKPAQLKSLLEKTSVDIWKPGADPYGKGRVDALNAVMAK